MDKEISSMSILRSKIIYQNVESTDIDRSYTANSINLKRKKSSSKMYRTAKAFHNVRNDSIITKFPYNEVLRRNRIRYKNSLNDVALTHTDVVLTAVMTTSTPP